MAEKKEGHSGKEKVCRNDRNTFYRRPDRARSPAQKRCPVSGAACRDDCIFYRHGGGPDEGRIICTRTFGSIRVYQEQAKAAEDEWVAIAKQLIEANEKNISHLTEIDRLKSFEEHWENGLRLRQSRASEIEAANAAYFEARGEKAGLADTYNLIIWLKERSDQMKAAAEKALYYLDSMSRFPDPRVNITAPAETRAALEECAASIKNALDGYGVSVTRDELIAHGCIMDNHEARRQRLAEDNGDGQ